MKDNFGETVLAKIMQRIEGASDKLAEQYRNVKPFDKKRIPDEDLLRSYNTFSAYPFLMERLRQKYGDDLVAEYIFDMEKLLRRRSKR